ncbi:MAG: xanthine dehydrogenase family protein subunit M [Candidatus Aminicenantaceae bacterium]
MHEFEFHSPRTLEEACELLKKHNGTARVLAGGTDLIPDMYHHKIAPGHIINIKKIPGLNRITYDSSKGLTIGALTKFNEIIFSETVKNSYPILVELTSKIASHQIRNLATIGGNLCNAAPSADSAPSLIAMDSFVSIIGCEGKRRTLPLEKFFVGPGITALEPGEILTKIHIPPLKSCTGMTYIKHTTRRALEIAVVGVAVLVQLEKDTDKCNHARIVIGACASTPLRIRQAEEILVGKKIGEKDIEASAEAASKAVAPITDIRGSDYYRREIVKIQCKRALEEALPRAYSIKAVEA